MSEEAKLNQTFLERFDRKETFDEWERKMMAWGEVGTEVDQIENDSGRWTTCMTTVFEIGGRYFAIDWDRGLTERQENEYWNQPYEVTKLRYEKTMVVTAWIPITEENDERPRQNR